jgi:hypothetical protein
MAMDNR